MSTPLTQIARSWFKFIKGDSYTKVLMTNRLAICDQCEHKTLITPAGQIVMRVLSNDPDAVYQCSKCGCPLMSKTADPMNECPLKKWTIAGQESYY
jgi:DNA-directed RNA polymerase subunit RPC12/RpoP